MVYYLGEKTVDTKKNNRDASDNVEVQGDEEILADVLAAASRNPISATREWGGGDQAILKLASKADRDTAYCESDDCKNPGGRTKLRGSRVQLGICSYCQPE